MTSDLPSSSMHVQVLSQPPSFFWLHIAVGLSPVPTGLMSNLITVVCLTATWKWNWPDKTLNQNHVAISVQVRPVGTTTVELAFVAIAAFKLRSLHLADLLTDAIMSFAKLICVLITAATTTQSHVRCLWCPEWKLNDPNVSAGCCDYKNLESIPLFLFLVDLC